MDKVKKSVLVPVIFFSWFGFPLTIKELRRYLWRHEMREEALVAMVKELPSVTYRDGLVWVGDKVSDRAELEQNAGRLWRRVARWRWIFANVPFMRAVFVSNTLSYNNARPGSDIDLLIVTAPGRIWTARAWLLVWMNLFNLRVRSQDRAAKFSPEFFVTETSWDVSAIALPHDYYLSFWVSDLVPVWPGGEANSFRQANRWYANDLPVAWRSPKEPGYHRATSSVYARSVEWCLRGRMGDWLESHVQRSQTSIIQRNLRRLGVNPQVVTSDDVIKLHFNDRRATVRDVINRFVDEVVE